MCADCTAYNLDGGDDRGAGWAEEADAQPLTALENGGGDGRRAQLNGEASQRRVRLHRRAWRCLGVTAALAAHPKQHPYNLLFLSPSPCPSLFPIFPFALARYRLPLVPSPSQA